ncbi:MAG: hypothetical protein RI897_3260 [Verrucomicrobiota bacterium]
MRLDGVIGAGEAGDGVEQDDDVFFVFHHTAGFFDHHFGDLDVAFRRFIEGGADDFCRAAGAFHVCYFLGAFIDEEDEQVSIRGIFDDGVGDLLEQDGFAGTRRCDDEAAGAFTDGADEVEDSGGHLFRVAFEHEALIGEERGEVIEVGFIFGLIGFFVADLFHFEEGEEAFLFFWGADLAVDDVTCLEVEAADLGGGDVNIFRAGQVVEALRAEEAEAFGQDFEHAIGEQGATALGVVLEDGVDELLFFHRAEVLDPHGFGHLGEFGDRGCLEVTDIDWGRGWCLVLGWAWGLLLSSVAVSVLNGLVVAVLAFVASGEELLLSLSFWLVLGFCLWLLGGFAGDGFAGDRFAGSTSAGDGFASWSFCFSGGGLFGFDERF